MSDEEPRVHPAIHYGEPIAVAVALIVIVAVLVTRTASPQRVSAEPPVTVHSPAAVPPFQDGDIVEAEELRTIIPGVDVKTGRKALLRRHLPYDGAGPETASYELVAGP